MAAYGDPRPFKQLIKLVARAFYAGQCPPSHYQAKDGEEGSRSKLNKIDTTGLGIVLLDYLMDREWVAEEQLTNDLGQHHKITRRALKYLEHEHLIMGEHRRETKRTQKNDTVKAAVDAKQQQMKQLQEQVKGAGDEDEEEAPQKQMTFSYWAIDYPRAFDMVQYRMYIMRKLLKDELDAKEAVAKYMCKTPHCGKEYDSFDMPDLIQPDGSLQCTMCRGVVEQVLAMGQTGDEIKRKERKEALKRVLQNLDSSLEPIIRLTASLRTTQPPHHGTLTDWARTQQAKLAQGGPGGGGGGGGGAGEAVRVRVGGGVTQLTQAAGAARTAAYQETHVQVTLAADTTTSTAAGSTAGVTATLSGHKRPSAAQPFFLRANKAAAASQAQAAVPLPQPVQQPKVEVDAYTQQMLGVQGSYGSTSMYKQEQAQLDIKLEERAAKRVKTEFGEELESGAEGVKAEGGDAGEEEWEEI